MSTPTSDNPHNAEAAAANNQRRRQLLLRVGLVVGVLAVVYGLWWFFVARHHEKTDNAYVAGNLVQVTPQVGGTVLAIHADDTDYVEAGQPLVNLDPADARVALDQAEAELGQRVRETRNLFANRVALAAAVQVRESELKRAEDDLQRRQRIADSGAVAVEEIEHARSAVQTATAALTSAREQLAATAALVDGTRVEQHPAVLKAAARVREVALTARRAVLPAPVSGYVAKRSVQVGQRIAPGTPLMAIVPLNALWVDANFKEGQLEKMRIGQPAKLTADVYGSGVVFHGTVAGLGAGTGGVFSLLPAQNATGNWIKVVQRVPVRVLLDAKELAEHPLRVGMSMEAEVDVADTAGKALAAAPRDAAIETKAFAADDAAVEKRIARIIAESLGATGK